MSILSGAHPHLFPKVVELVREKGLTDALIIGGGVIPEGDIPALKEAGVSRSRGLRVKPDSLIEGTAFVYWAGGDWRKHYESGGKIEIKPQPDDMEDNHIGRPKLNKTTRRPRTVQPKDTPQPKTTPQPKVEVASPNFKIDPINLSATRTSVTITGTISEILKILTLINEHSK
jgi:hypothetical protein